LKFLSLIWRSVKEIVWPACPADAGAAAAMATPAPAASSMTAAVLMRILFTFSSLVTFRRV